MTTEVQYSNNMSSYKPLDSKREEFRMYVEKTGVVDALTKKPEKPDNTLEYIGRKLSTIIPGSHDQENLLAKLEEANLKIEKLEQENRQLRSCVPNSNTSLPNQTTLLNQTSEQTGSVAEK